MKTNSALNNHPQFIESNSILTKLNQALADEQRIESELFERLNQLCTAPIHADDVEIAIDLAEGKQTPAGGEAISASIRESQAKQNVLKAGIERQEQRLSDLVATLSIDHANERRTEHLSIVKSMRTALEKLRDALQAEKALRDSIKDNGYRDTLPGLLLWSFEPGSQEDAALRELAHYEAIHGRTLSESKKVTGIALCDFNAFGVTGESGQTLSVSELTGELLRHHGLFDPAGKAVRQSRIHQLAEIIHE